MSSISPSGFNKKNRRNEWQRPGTGSGNGRDSFDDGNGGEMRTLNTTNDYYSGHLTTKHFVGSSGPVLYGWTPGVSN